MHRHLKFLPRHEYCTHSHFQKGEINYLNRNASPSQVMQRYCSLTEKNVLGKKIKYFTNFTRKINKFKCFENEGLNILQILQEKTNKSKCIKFCGDIAAKLGKSEQNIYICFRNKRINILPI